MFGFKLFIDFCWVNMVEMEFEEIFIDYVYCEQKVAIFCILLIQGYLEYEDFVWDLALIVIEEWGYFCMVFKELDKCGFKFGCQCKDEYVNKLLVFYKKGGSWEDCLLDKFLICVFIEACSCEWFCLFFLNIWEEEFKEWYYKFMVAEVGYYCLFIDLVK